MKVYLSGKITGLPGGDYKKLFAMYEKEMQKQGHFVVNPLSLARELKQELKRQPTYQEYIKKDIAELLKCEAICLLPNWKQSKGAYLEKQIADIVGLKIIEYRLID